MVVQSLSLAGPLSSSGSSKYSSSDEKLLNASDIGLSGPEIYSSDFYYILSFWSKSFPTLQNSTTSYRQELKHATVMEERSVIDYIL